MGSFETTCGISQTAISYGEPILLLILDDRYYNRLKDFPMTGMYDLYNENYRAISNSDNWYKDYMKSDEHKNFKGTDIEEMAFIDTWIDNYKNDKNRLERNSDAQVKVCEFGEYNEYGWIDGASESNDNNRDHCLYFHQWALEEILNKDIETIKNIRQGTLLTNIFEACYDYRINLFGTLLFGQQYTDKKELKKQLRLTKAKEKFIKNKLQTLADSND